MCVPRAAFELRHLLYKGRECGLNDIFGLLRLQTGGTRGSKRLGKVKCDDPSQGIAIPFAELRHKKGIVDILIGHSVSVPRLLK
jgi:hypothetical protein